MPVMLPPGQGTTVTLPGQSAQAVVPAAQGPGPQARLTAPPSPFRQAHGPDVLIMPHTEEQPQPQQFQRPGRLLRLARRALRLALSREDLDPWVQSFAANPNDDAPHHVFADYLDEAGDPRAEVVRQQLARGREPNGRFLHPKSATVYGGELDGRHQRFFGDRTGGFTVLTPHRTQPLVYVAWTPRNVGVPHDASTYRGLVSPEHVHEIALVSGLHPSYLANWPDHVKPKIITDPS